MFSPYFVFHYPGWFNLQSTGLFLTADILICHSRKITGVTNDINNYDSVTVRQNAQYQEAAKWNSTIIHFIIYTCAFPTVTCLP